jgi:hypothetical protein
MISIVDRIRIDSGLDVGWIGYSISSAAKVFNSRKVTSWS